MRLNKLKNGWRYTPKVILDGKNNISFKTVRHVFDCLLTSILYFRLQHRVNFFVCGLTRPSKVLQEKENCEATVCLTILTTPQYQTQSH